MNYRLVPEARYPSGGEDVELALKWIRDNIGTDENGRGDPDQLVLIGQSAGAAHIASYLYRDGDADLMQAGKATPHRHPVAKAVAYLSAPFFFDASKARRAQTLRCVRSLIPLKQSLSGFSANTSARMTPSKSGLTRVQVSYRARHLPTLMFPLKRCQHWSPSVSMIREYSSF